MGSCLLHRKEGDQGNAAYWYGRAGKPVCREPLDAEWLSIVNELLEFYLASVSDAASGTISSSKKSESIRFTT